MNKAKRLKLLEEKIMADIVQIESDNDINLVFGSGDSDADIFFVYDAPLADVPSAEIPPKKIALEHFHEVLEAANTGGSGVYIAPIVKWRTNKMRLEPNDEQIEVCRNYMLKQIEIVNPKVIVALGINAYSALKPSTNERAALSARGTWREVNGRYVTLSLSPLQLARKLSEEEKSEFYSDIKSAIRQSEFLKKCSDNSDE